VGTLFSKLSFSLFGKDFNFSARIIKKKSFLHWGMGNRCSDGKYVLFLDYDKTPYSWIMEEIGLLRHEFPGLGRPYVFKTKRGFHVVFLDKFFLWEIISMMKLTTCDKDYQNIALWARSIWILRQSEKADEEITYIPLDGDDGFTSLEKSRAHRDYLYRYCSVPHEDLPLHHNLDESKDLTFGYYHIGGENQ
jgi:hypothetical protein